jgi:hypothetical protein
VSPSNGSKLDKEVLDAHIDDGKQMFCPESMHVLAEQAGTSRQQLEERDLRAAKAAERDFAGRIIWSGNRAGTAP